jgi:tRNA threonylcarbamoyladenosine modification (KEOPS) complex Cgi121 subunit
MISRSLAMEILLYISGSRQISEALDRVGVRGDTEKIVVVAVTKSREEAERINDYLAKSNLKTDDALLDEWTPSRKSTLRKVFGLTEKELQAASRGSAEPVEKTIQRLMIERSAVLAVKK